MAPSGYIVPFVVARMCNHHQMVYLMLRASLRPAHDGPEVAEATVVFESGQCPPCIRGKVA